MKNFNLILCLIVICLLSSCIEIKETLKVNPDGSGNIKLVVDMGKMGKSLGSQNQQINMSFINEIQSTPDKADSLLKTCRGITNLKTSSGKENGVYSISFDFKNYKALNAALYKLFRQKKTSFSPDFIKVTKHKIRQMNFAPLIKKYVIKDESNMISDMLYQLIKIESTFMVPSKVKNVSNIKAVQEDGNNNVTV